MGEGEKGRGGRRGGDDRYLLSFAVRLTAVIYKTAKIALLMSVDYLIFTDCHKIVVSDTLLSIVVHSHLEIRLRVDIVKSQLISSDEMENKLMNIQKKFLRSTKCFGSSRVHTFEKERASYFSDSKNDIEKDGNCYPCYLVDHFSAVFHHEIARCDVLGGLEAPALGAGVEGACLGVVRLLEALVLAQSTTDTPRVTETKQAIDWEKQFYQQFHQNWLIIIYEIGTNFVISKRL